MRDISAKSTTLRIATAQSVLTAATTTVERLRNNDVPKKDPLIVARIAAVQAAKNTMLMIPYCHPIAVHHVDVQFELLDTSVVTTVLVKSIERTGVEMEALTAATAATLTLYDMLKMIDKDMEITQTRLLSKQGGKTDYSTTVEGLRAAVLVISDRVSAGQAEDSSGVVIQEALQKQGFVISANDVVPDQTAAIAQCVSQWADNHTADLVVTTGGTGLSPRDITPEALSPLFDRAADSISEAIRSYGQQRTPMAMLSRATAGVRGNTLIICLPGSKTAVTEAMQVLKPVLPHALKIVAGNHHTSTNTYAATNTESAQC